MVEINSNYTPTAVSSSVKPQESKKVDNVETSEDTEKSAKSKVVKYLAAAGALGTVIVGGLMYRNHSAKVLREALDSACRAARDAAYNAGTTKDNNVFEILLEYFDESKLVARLDAISNKPKKDQVQAFKDMEDVIQSMRGTDLRLDLKRGLDISKLPKEMQDVFATKDEYAIIKAYDEYCNTLFKKSKSAGETIEESIKNVFGGSTTVKPHTYDLTQEADRIATNIYTGARGYTDITVLSNNLVPDSRNWKNVLSVYSNNFLPEGAKYNISQYTNNEGKTVVSIVYPTPNRADSLASIHLLSKDLELTPAQKDLLKLKGQDLPIAEFQKINSGVGDNVNYDAILSIIQTEAAKVKVE